MRGRKRMILSRIRRMGDPAARRTALGAVFGWILIGAATASASVLGALVFVPDYEWRYQLAERHLPFEQDLVANWRLDVVAGEWTPDSRPQSRDGHVVGATPEDDGRLDGAIYLDGAHDYVDMGERFHDLEYPVTLTAWVRSTGNRESSIQNVVWLGGGKSNEYIYIGMKYGHATIESRSGESLTARSVGKITDGAWHHLAGVFVSESHRLLYSDGELVAEDRQFSEKPPTINLQIGRNGRKSMETSYTHGSIDDVRVYKAALDQAAVREIMKGDFAIIAARESVSAE
jgi:hypothetical protein